MTYMTGTYFCGDCGSHVLLLKYGLSASGGGWWTVGCVNGHHWVPDPATEVRVEIDTEVLGVSSPSP